MSKQTRLLSGCAVAAVVLAAILPVTKSDGAYSPGHGLAGSGYHIVTTGVADKVEPDPTDDGSIIVECVMLGNRLTTGAGGLELDPKSTLVGVPRFQLGPSKCWPQDQN